MCNTTRDIFKDFLILGDIRRSTLTNRGRPYTSKIAIRAVVWMRVRNDVDC